MLKNRVTFHIKYPLVILGLMYSHFTLADIYDLKGTDSVIGQLNSTRAEFGETLLDIGRKNGFGYRDLKILNPDIDTWIPGENREIILPGQFIIPNVPRQGIVLNIPEMRLYYFPETKAGLVKQVITYPLGIGREGWSTPYMKTQIVQKTKSPSWYPPESIRKEHEEMGDPLPKIVKPGPGNPLGDYAMRLGARDYLIHGTNKPFGVGMRVSHGCIRLYPEDIEDLFQRVSVGTPVNIINQPYKIGELDGVIYLEVHPHLDEDNERFTQNSLTEVVKYIIATTEENRYEIDWDLVKKIVAEAQGVPVAIGIHTPGLQANVDEEIQPQN
jgi:L,D-transpeptidase ErfK/SrfK